MTRNSKRIKALLIISGILVFAALTMGILFAVGVFSAKLMGLGFLFLVLAFLFSFAGIYAGRRILETRRQLRALVDENLYSFGFRSEFPNLYVFDAMVRASRLHLSLRRRPQTLIGFSFSPIAVSSNPEHNDAIAAMNYSLSQEIDSFLAEQRKNHTNLAPTLACFNRGVFFLYIYGTEEQAIALCEHFASAIYRLGAAQRSKVLIQPFFGIAKTDPDEAIALSTENALLARSHGENTFEPYTVYDPSFKDTTTQREMEELQEALANKEMVVYYQPKFSLKEKRFVSSEALVRWHSPRYGVLSPGAFIEKAEHAGLISDIDLYVFEATLKDLAQMRVKGHRVLPVSVNFSLYEFFSPNFLDVIVSLLDKYKIPPTLIEIEITETTSQANQFMSIQIIKKLKDRGVRVLMDDFGIGYSGIDNLRKIPFDGIKVDKTFSDQLVDDEKTRAIVKLIVELGHLNGIEVIIEGVDSQAQVDILKKMKMDTIQGFYYSKAIPLDQYEAFLKDNPFEGKGGKRP